MIVVTNAGPLMALAKLGLLHLLGQLYGKVEMPTAVYNEVVLRGMEQRIIEKKWYGSSVKGLVETLTDEDGYRKT